MPAARTEQALARGCPGVEDGRSWEWKFQRGPPSGSDTSQQPATRKEATEGVAGRQSRKTRGTAEVDRLRQLSGRSQGRSEPRARPSLALMSTLWERHGPSDSGIAAHSGTERARRTRRGSTVETRPSTRVPRGERGTKELDNTRTPDPAASVPQPATSSPTDHHPTAEAK